MPKLPSYHYDSEASKARIQWEKRVAKAFGTYNFTPQWANRLAAVFCALAEDPNERKIGVLGLIKRVLEGGSK